MIKRILHFFLSNFKFIKIDRALWSLQRGKSVSFNTDFQNFILAILQIFLGKRKLNYNKIGNILYPRRAVPQTSNVDTKMGETDNFQKRKSFVRFLRSVKGRWRFGKLFSFLNFITNFVYSVTFIIKKQKVNNTSDQAHYTLDHNLPFLITVFQNIDHCYWVVAKVTIYLLIFPVMQQFYEAFTLFDSLPGIL